MGTRYDVSSLRRQQLNQAFTYHPPNEDQAARYIALRTEAKVLAEMIVMHTPESWEQSIAFTKLDEVVMWANAAIARNEASETDTVPG